MLRVFRIALPILLLGAAVTAQELKSIELPKPDTTGGKPLMQVLKNRHSSREFSADTLPMPVLSNLLWAACGINRAGEGKRTSPSAMNWQEIDVYVATAQGLFLYDPIKHVLQPVLSEDIREKTGMQPFVKDVPVNLVYVADMARIEQGVGCRQELLYRRRCRICQRECLSVLRVGRSCDCRARFGRSRSSGKGDETARRSENHSCPVGWLSEEIGAMEKTILRLR